MILKKSQRTPRAASSPVDPPAEISLLHALFDKNRSKTNFIYRFILGVLLCRGRAPFLSCSNSGRCRLGVMSEVGPRTRPSIPLWGRAAAPQHNPTSSMPELEGTRRAYHPVPKTLKTKHGTFS